MAKRSRQVGAEHARARQETRRGKEETREQLLHAAMELFAQKGYHGSSVRDLAAAAGVTTGAFYSNFRSKREIYIAIIEKITDAIQSVVDEMTAETIEIMKQRGGAPMEHDLLVKPLVRLLEEASRHDSLMHILRREGLGRDPEFQRDFDRVWERFVDLSRRTLDRYIEAGFAKAYDTELAARALVPMFIAMSLYDGLTKAKRRMEIATLVAAMLQGGTSLWVSWQSSASFGMKTEPKAPAGLARTPRLG